MTAAQGACPAAVSGVTHLAFRDALREDAALAVACLRLKQRLAALLPTDQIACAEAKSDVVAAVLRARSIQ